MTTHKVVPHDVWVAARKKHLAKEKEFTQMRDQLSQERRDLPCVAGKMPAWGPQLGAEKTKLLAGYVLSLKGTNLPGKAPEGKPED